MLNCGVSDTEKQSGAIRGMQMVSPESLGSSSSGLRLFG